jgi:hypothetical protein
MYFRRIALVTVITTGLTAGLVGCSSTAQRNAGGDTSTTITAATSAVVTTAPAVTTAPPATAPPATAPPVTTPSLSLYDEVAPPTAPGGHTDPFASSGVLADGVYWSGCTTAARSSPRHHGDAGVLRDECESAASAAGEECLNDIFVLERSQRDIADLPFHDNVYLTVADGDPAELLDHARRAGDDPPRAPAMAPPTTSASHVRLPDDGEGRRDLEVRADLDP